MRFRFFTFVMLVVFCPPLIGQPGCTDPQATNFNVSATDNDGSCTYPFTSLNIPLVTNLPDALKEISGHTFADGKWWAHEDGTTNPVFYQIDPQNGQIQQNITLENATNKDWEEVTANSTHLFLGDFGNNNNDREDLGIYKLPLTATGTGSVQIIADSLWTFIPFAYPEQTDFSTVPRDSTTFDAEAFIWKNGQLHLFTKNWKTYETSHYTVDPESGATTLLETFDTDGLITGAAISPDSQLVVLLGYNLKTQYAAFIWLLWDWPEPGNPLLFTGNKRRIELGSILVTGQTESIAFAGNRSGNIGNERSSAGGVVFAQQALKSFDISAWVPETVSGVSEVIKNNTFSVAPNPFYHQLRLQGDPGTYCIKNCWGQVMASGETLPVILDTQNWPAGIYVGGTGEKWRKFIKM